MYIQFLTAFVSTSTYPVAPFSNGLTDWGVLSVKARIGDKSRHLNRESLMKSLLISRKWLFWVLKKELLRSSKVEVAKKGTTSRLGKRKKRIKELKTRKGFPPHSDHSSWALKLSLGLLQWRRGFHRNIQQPPPPTTSGSEEIARGPEWETVAWGRGWKQPTGAPPKWDMWLRHSWGSSAGAAGFLWWLQMENRNPGGTSCCYCFAAPL